MASSFVFYKDKDGKALPENTVVALGQFQKISRSDKFPNTYLVHVNDPERGQLKITIGGSMKNVFPQSDIQDDWKEFIGRTFEFVYMGEGVSASGPFKGKPFHKVDVFEIQPVDAPAVASSITSAPAGAAEPQDDLF